MLTKDDWFNCWATSNPSSPDSHSNQVARGAFFVDIQPLIPKSPAKTVASEEDKSKKKKQQTVRGKCGRTR